jgi:hypothetical protein
VGYSGIWPAVEFVRGHSESPEVPRSAASSLRATEERLLADAEDLFARSEFDEGLALMQGVTSRCSDHEDPAIRALAAEALMREAGVNQELLRGSESLVLLEEVTNIYETDEDQ